MLKEIKLSDLPKIIIYAGANHQEKITKFLITIGYTKVYSSAQSVSQSLDNHILPAATLATERAVEALGGPTTIIRNTAEYAALISSIKYHYDQLSNSIGTASQEDFELPLKDKTAVAQ